MDRRVKPKVTNICKFCKKIFYTLPCNIKMFCSKKCVSESLKIGQCKFCKKSIKAQHKFCCKEHRKQYSINNFLRKFKEGRTAYYDDLSSYIYEYFKDKIKGYDIHHLDCNEKNNHKDNLLLLNPRTHQKLHLLAYRFIVQQNLLKEYFQFIGEDLSKIRRLVDVC